MNKYKRIFMIVTDSLGVGGDPRAQEFGDLDANTFQHIADTGLLKIPTWKKLGIGSVVQLKGQKKPKKQLGYTMRLSAMSNAKDTLAGHWEMMGIETKIPFPTFTKTGFPPALIAELSKAFDGREIIGNRAASGTEIIKELGAAEIKDHKVIVYTSADPVLQICGNEATMGLKTLYRYGQAARKICNANPQWNVGRVIVRPYVGTNASNFTRTANRHDYAVEPPQALVLDYLKTKGVNVVAIGKINDIYSGRGIQQALHSESNNDGMDLTIDFAETAPTNSFIFTNLVEFDSHYGHRRDLNGYAHAINDFDIKLTKLINAMKAEDLLIITSDHGNDPTFPGSDHTREFVPGTVYAPNFQTPHHLGDLKGFGTLGNIVAQNWGVAEVATGENINEQLI